MEKIVLALQHTTHPICKQAALHMQKKSPTSLKVTLKALQAGKQMDFDACMRQEYRLTYHFLEAHDFAEGIRAVIIDKDQAPQWIPRTLEDVTNIGIQEYFAPLAQELA